MSDGERIARQKATPIVEALVAMFAPHCDWISPGGSYRREKADIGDVEIVAIPKPSLLTYMDELVTSGAIAKKEYINEKTGKVSYRWGEKWRAFVHNGIKFDLFLCDMDNRGNTYWLRTGSGEANQWLMGVFHQYKAPFRVESGYIWTKDSGANVQKLHIPDEQAWFGLLGIPFIEPKDRSIDTYQRLIRWGHVWGDVNDYLPAPSPKAVDADKSKSNSYAFEEWVESPKNTAQTPKKATPKKTQWEWTAPFLCDDGLVWVHVGYGKWAKRPQDDSQAMAQLAQYRLLPRSRDAMAYTLQIKLQNMALEERLVTAVQKSLAILRGVA